MRFNEISKKAVPYSFPKKSNVLKEVLASSVQKLEVLKKEKESFLTQKLKNPSDLEDQRIHLEGKLKQLKMENEALKSKKENKKNEPSGVEREILNEIDNYKKQIEEMQKQHEKNLQIIRSLKEKRGDLSAREGSEAGDKELEKLWKIEKNLKSSLKSSDAKYKQMLKEMENNAEKLTADKICLQMKILKTNQQERLLQMTIDKSLGDGEHNFTDANFLYKPSLKGLYH